MTATAFDTLAYAEELQKAGLPEAHAKAHAKALAEALKSGIAELVTKADLDALRTATRADLAELKQELRVQEERNGGRFRLMYWMLGFNLALSAAMLWALVRLGSIPGIP